MHNFDLFAIEPNFKIKRNSKYSNTFSFSLSIINFILIAIAIIYFSSSLFDKSFPKQVSRSITVADNSLSLNNENFYFSFVVMTSNKGLIALNNYFELKAFNQIKTSSATEMKELQIEQCNTKKHSLAYSKLPEDFRHLSHCIDFSGIYLRSNTEEFSESKIVLKLSKCNNADCKTPDNIKEVNQYQFTFNMSNTIYDPTSFNSPNEVVNNSIDIGSRYASFWMHEMLFSKKLIETDRQNFFSFYDSEESFTFEHIMLKPYSQEELHKNDILFSLNLSKQLWHEKRNYVKMQQIAVEIGGMMKFIMTLTTLLFDWVNQNFYFIYIHDYQSSKSFYKHDRQRRTSAFLVNNNNSLGNIRHHIRRPDLMFDISKNDLHSSISSLDIILAYTCCKTKHSKRFNEVKENYANLFNMRSDILWFFKYQMEVEALKDILLTKEQNQVISFFNCWKAGNKYEELSYMLDKDFAKLPSKEKQELRESLEKLEASESETDIRILEMIGFMREY